MPDVLLFALIVLFIVITLGVFIGQFDGPRTQFNPLWIITSLLALGCIGWFIAYINTEERVAEVVIVTSSTIDGVDIVIHRSTLFNLNEIFKRDISEGTKIKVSYYESSYMTSVGVYCLSSMKAARPHLEIIEDDNSDT